MPAALVPCSLASRLGSKPMIDSTRSQIEIEIEIEIKLGN
jgi:hypothetical protein